MDTQQAATPTAPCGREDVVLLVSLVDFGFGGLETHLLELATQFVARGLKPVVVTRKDSTLHRRAVAANLPCHAIAWLRFVRGQPLRSALLTLSLTSIGRRYRIRLIHCNNRFELDGARRAARHLGCPTIFNFHVTYDFDSAILHGIDAFVAPHLPSVLRIRDLRRAGADVPAVAEQLPPLVPTERFVRYKRAHDFDAQIRSLAGGTPPSAPVVCSVGNLVSDLGHKNYPLVFQALAVLRATRGDAPHVWIAGDGPARGQLEGLAQRLAIADRVRFLGFVTDVAPIIDFADMLVLASAHEAFGIALVEAALLGKPAIAARGTGADQIVVDGETGLLFENGNADSLAAAIARLASDRALRQRLGASARERAMERFMSARVAARYLALYHTLGVSMPHTRTPAESFVVGSR